MTNKTQNNATREDIIEALKGLTFRFEVKIVDIVPPGSHDNPTPPVPEKGDETGPKQISFGKLAPKEQQRPTLTNSNVSPVEIQEASTVRVPDIPREVSEPPKNLSRPSEDFTAPKLEKVLTEIPSEEPPKEEVKPAPRVTLDSPIKNVQEKPKVQAKPPLIRGAMKIGTTVTTFCISVDDKTSPPVSFVTYDNEKLLEITKSIQDVSLDIETQPEVSSIEVGDIVFAKSQDDNAWYRAIIEAVEDEKVRVYFFDWGLRETLSYKRVRRLTQPSLGLSQFPACALKVKFSNEPGPLLNEALKCESEFQMKVDSYDEASETYTGTIIST